MLAGHHIIREFYEFKHFIAFLLSEEARELYLESEGVMKVFENNKVNSLFKFSTNSYQKLPLLSLVIYNYRKDNLWVTKDGKLVTQGLINSKEYLLKESLPEKFLLMASYFVTDPDYYIFEKI